MKRFFMIHLLWIPFLWLNAQEKTLAQSLTQDEIESRRIAYLSAAISLTPLEAARFWPVYNEWNKKMEANMKARRDALRQIRQLDKSGSKEEKAYTQQNKILVDGAAEEARIITDAHQAYISIIGSIRTAQLYSAEDQFRNTLIRELRQNAK